LRETEETANERRGCCLARTRRALLLLLKAIGASLEAIVLVDNCGLVCGLRCDFKSRIDDRLAGMVNASANHKPPLYLVVNDFSKLPHLHSGLNVYKIYM
jgi:hypothetical protein